jgi:hypothetical protein
MIIGKKNWLFTVAEKDAEALLPWNAAKVVRLALT